ncbi:MAG: nucleotidyl transferase AbiEii/AbiGii toxin family protein [Candidatus Obscuribacterales bacterium]
MNQWRSTCDSKLIHSGVVRSGTAINKLLFQKPLRYSEDIDLVQIQAEPIGALIDGVRAALPWLGNFSKSQAEHSTHFVFKFVPESAPESQLKLKVEINTREHKNLHGIRMYPFEVISEWYQSSAQVASFEPEELFGTKLRALLQRRKNRDLFDLNQGLIQLALDTDRLIACFEHYLSLQGQSITRAMAEKRMLQKLEKSLTEDIAPLLPAGTEFTDEDAIVAFGRIWYELIQSLAGEPWKFSERAIEELRSSRMPKLLL